MNNFYEESPMTEPTHTLWVEKYRPKNLDSFIGNTSFKSKLQQILNSNNLEHLMLFGSSPGTGKTSAAKLIVNTIECDSLYLNCSDTNGIDDVRTKIKSFASTLGFKSLKVVICDECDFLSLSAQSALRSIIETYSLTTRFIFTCNYIEKMMPAIVSRCEAFEIIPTSKKEVAILLKKILDLENVKYTMDDFTFIVNTYYPDIRKVIVFAQQSVRDGKLELDKSAKIDLDFKLKIVDLLKNRTKASFSSIRQIVADADIKHFDDLYSFLYDKSEEISKNNEIITILTLAEYMYQSNLVVDKEITFMACIAKLLSEN